MKLRYLRVTTDRDRTVEGEANELTHSSKYLDLGRGAHGSSKARALNRQLAYDQVTAAESGENRLELNGPCGAVKTRRDGGDRKSVV